MKTYVVNMAKDTVKRAQIEAQLAEHPELDYQIWTAVEGRKAPPAPAAPLPARTRKAGMTAEARKGSSSYVHPPVCPIRCL